MAKSLRNRYSRSLEGLNAQGFFSGAVAYAAATSLAAFASTGTEGQVGIFNADTGALVTAALTAGTPFVIAQIVDGELKTSTKQVFGAPYLEITKTDYDAPVFQSVALGWNGTGGDLNIDIVGGLQEFVVRVNETTPANQPFPTLEGRAVVRNPNTNDYDVASAIVKDLNSQYDYERNADEEAVSAYVVTQPASVAYTNAVTVPAPGALAGQQTIIVSDAQDIAVGDIVVFAAAGANPAEASYQVIAVATGGAVESITLDRPLVADVAATTAVTKKDYDPADDTKNSVGIIITAVAEDVTFSVGVSEDLAAADITTLTEWKQGSGAGWQVASMEKETQVFAGETTQNIAFRDDFGRPNSFVAEAVNYDLWFLKYRKETDSMAYANEATTAFGYIIMAAPESGTSPTANFDTVLGT